MNDFILKKAQKLISLSKDKALFKAEQNLSLLRGFTDFSECENTLRKAQVTYSLLAENTRADFEKEILRLKSKKTEIIEKHGFKEKDLEPQFSCGICEDEGYVNGVRCKCLKKALRALLTSESQINDPNCTFAASKETNEHNIQVFSGIKKICENKAKEKNVLLLGKPGSGKTYLLTAAANEFIKAEKSVLFLTAYDLNRQFLQYHLADIERKDLIFDNLIDADVLIIDDLGTENILRNVTVEYLFVLLNERISEKKNTFISTNLALSNIFDRYDERIFSRMTDQRKTFVAELIDADKRLAKN